MKLLLRENFPDRRHFEFEQQAKYWLLFSCRDHLAHDGQIDRCQKEVRTVACVSRLANVDSLLALHEDNQTGFVCGRSASGGYGAAVEAQTWYLSERVSFRKGTISNLAGQFCPPLNQALIYAWVVVLRHFRPFVSFKTKLTPNSQCRAQKCTHRQE